MTPFTALALRLTAHRRGIASLGVLSVIVSVTVVSAAVVAPTAYQPQGVVAPMRDPMLAAAVYGGMGLIILWFARLNIAMKEKIERICLRVEDPQTGLVVTLGNHMHETRGAVGALANEVEDIQHQVAGIAATCAAHHGRGHRETTT
jgi:hypothetical protein